MNRRWLAWTMAWLAILGFALPAGCRDSGATRSAPGASATGAPAPIDLGAVVRRVRRSYRRVDGGFAARGDGWLARVDDGGALSLSARGAPAAMRIATSGVTVGAVPIALAAPSVRVDREGALTVDRGAVVERFANHERGVEQSFAFAERPPGRGDLAVRIDAPRGAFQGASERGLAYHDAATGVRLTYGHGTWIDARGARTPVPAVAEGDGIVLRVPAEVVMRSAYPAVLDPTVELTSPVAGDLALSQRLSPTAASGGGLFLVAWEEDESNPEDARVSVARVKTDGTVLDPGGITLGVPASPPWIGFDGTNFLVGTIEEVQRVSPAGVVVDASPLSLQVFTQSGACGPGSCLLASVDVAGEVVAQIVDTSGASLSAAPQIQIASGSATGTPSVAFNGLGYLVVWTDQSAASPRTYASRVKADGTVSDPNGFPVSATASGQQAPAVAFDGGSYLVAWEDDRVPATQDTVYARLLDASGTLMGTDLLVSPAGVPVNGFTLAADGAGFVLGWNGGGPTVARLSDAGALLDAQGFPLGPSGSDVPTVACAGGTCLGVWLTTTPEDVVGARFDAGTGATLDATPFTIAFPGDWQQEPAVARGGSTFLVVWEDFITLDGLQNIYGVRVDTTGNVLDPTGIQISSGPNGQAFPKVASDGTDFFVTWLDCRVNAQKGCGGMSQITGTIYGARVGGDGTVLDPAGIAVSPGATHQLWPAVAFDGAHYLVVWSDEPTQPYRVRGARVSTAGALLDTTAAVLEPGDMPAVACNGQSCLVASSDGAVRVSQALEVLDASPIQFSSSGAGYVAVASDGTDYLVAWSPECAVFAARVSAGGVVLDPAGLVLSPDLSGGWCDFEPSASFDGTNYAVAWAHDRVVPILVVAGVTPAGAVFDDGWQLDEQENDCIYVDPSPSVAGDGAGNWFVVWGKFDDRSSTARVFGELFAAPPPPPPDAGGSGGGATSSSGAGGSGGAGGAGGAGTATSGAAVTSSSASSGSSSSSTSGSSSGAGGSGGSAGTGGPAGGSSQGGCGCREAGAPPGGLGAFALPAALAMLGCLRRRSARVSVGCSKAASYGGGSRDPSR